MNTFSDDFAEPLGTPFFEPKEKYKPFPNFYEKRFSTVVDLSLFRSSGYVANIFHIFFLKMWALFFKCVNKVIRCQNSE